MTTSPLPLPSEYEWGFVTGRAIHAIGDTTADVDRFPEARPGVGRCQFTPLQKLRTVTVPPTFVIHETVTATLNSDGVLSDVTNQPGIWLITGVYRVTWAVAGGTLPSIDILVTTEHTQENPLDLALQAPYVPPVGVTPQVILIPANIPQGWLLSRDGNTVKGIDPATLGGGGGGTSVPNVLSIGTVTSGPTADATIRGESPEQILDLVLPVGPPGASAPLPEIFWQGTQLSVDGALSPDLKGAPGDPGSTPVLSWQGTALAVDGVVGPDLKGEPGSSPPPPEFSWSGTQLSIDGTLGPDLKGEPGQPGEPGEPGDDGTTPVLAWQGTALTVDGVAGPDLKGEKGDPGDPGADSTVPGPANNIGIGTVSTGAAGSSAVATVTGVYPDQKLNLTIPRGDKGTDGTSPTITTAALNTPGLLQAVFIEPGGTIPVGTPSWSFVIEVDS